MSCVPRVIGIDPGTVSIDLCGLDDGRVFLDESLPTTEALADPRRFVGLLESSRPLDLVVGPSGYGLPLTRARDLTETDLRLAYLTADGDGGIGGLRSLARALAASDLPVVFTPGVVHLASVPAHRKVNRVDMGTADKVCAAALAIRELAQHRGCEVRDVSLIHLELGGAFSAALAVEGGRIVDGLGGTSGPIGIIAAGALDGEVAFLAGAVTKRMLFGGGAMEAAGFRAGDAGDSEPHLGVDAFATLNTPRGQVAWDAYLEGAVKAVATLRVAAPSVRDIVISGRVTRVARVRDELQQRIARVAPDLEVRPLRGFTSCAKEAAQGAAVIADGLAGGSAVDLVDTLGIAGASGSVLDHLVFITPAAARRRLGIADA